MADKTKVYHISKRSDGKWAIKFAGGEKVIKTFAKKNLLNMAMLWPEISLELFWYMLQKARMPAKSKSNTIL